MVFTYDSYRALINKLKDQGYCFLSYSDWEDHPKCVILRHDIDNDISKAVKLATVEKELGVKSTFFVLVTSDFYNVFSARSEAMLHEIAACGHEIGLHFDEVRYHDIKTQEDIKNHILEEVEILSGAVGKSIEAVSMHRPSKMMLEADLNIPGLINSYGKVFFDQFKYLSDSRRRWREPIDEIIASGEYDRLHILTHAIWYNDSEMDIHDSICGFVNSANLQRYDALESNITDLEAIMRREEVK